MIFGLTLPFSAALAMFPEGFLSDRRTFNLSSGWHYLPRGHGTVLLVITLMSHDAFP